MISDIHPSKKTLSPSSFQEEGDLNGRKFSTSVEQQPLIEGLESFPEAVNDNDHFSELLLKEQVQHSLLSNKVFHHQKVKMIFHKHFPAIPHSDEKFEAFYSNFLKGVNDLVKGDWEAFLKTDIDPFARSLAAKIASKIKGEFKKVCERIIQDSILNCKPARLKKVRSEIVYEKIRIEIAKIAAHQDGGRTSEYIQSYGITDESALIEIAKIAAKQYGGGTSEYIQSYGITDESALIEIAKIAAMQDGNGTSCWIQEYGITDESALIEIAKIAAEHNGEWTSYWIPNYGITDESALIEIAKIAAKQDGWGTSKYIHEYGITDESALIEIAKIAAMQDGKWTAFRGIQNYGITNESAIDDILKIANASSNFAI